MKTLQKRLGFCVICLMLLTISFFFFSYVPSPLQIGEQPHSSVNSKPDIRLMSSVPGKDINDVFVKEDEHLKQEIFDALYQEFDGFMHHPVIQLQAIEQLVRILSKCYPSTWENLVEDYLIGFFPDYAEELIDHYHKLQNYTQWSEENRDVISALSPLELRDSLWAARLSIFGDEAYIIWESELKQDDVRWVLSDLNEQTGVPFHEKTTFYKERLVEIYGDTSEVFIKKHQQVFINKFLSLDTIQEDLHSMTNDDRRLELNTLRKTLGYDENALKRWETLDDERENRWISGLEYMAEREKILTTTPDDTVEDRIDELRRSYFGDILAETIRKEETSGLYRFTRKRLYGKN